MKYEEINMGQQFRVVPDQAFHVLEKGELVEVIGKRKVLDYETIQVYVIDPKSENYLLVQQVTPEELVEK